MTDMNEASKALRYFKQLQKEHGYKDNSNVMQAKFDMKDILEHIEDEKEIKKLMLFFLKTSDDKSFKYFKRQYADYYETMLYIIQQRKEDRALIRRNARNKN